VQLHKTGDSALECFKRDKIDLGLFDVKLPGMDGFSLCHQIRSMDIKIPIIFLTGISQPESISNKFDLGSYDYLEKPYSMKELIARIGLMLGRNGLMDSIEINKQVYYFGKYRFELPKNELYYNGETHNLTRLECRILRMLIDNRNKVIDRRIILNKYPLYQPRI